ncbi:MAG: hypothetical protein H6581_03670 [Bacteroidia bacterium]|nr:hypothetical protein [Bacteroidia bacterium]
MKKVLLSVCCLFWVHQVFALSFYQQLCAFNPNWAKYVDRAPGGESRTFATDQDLVAAHLGSVLTILRSNPVVHLSQAQFHSRQHLIEVLDGYRKAGNFPLNYYRHERIPVFIDEHDTHCAVGYLLQQTGREDLARRIAAADNYVWVKDIHEADLLAWQQESGFSLEELKLIQGAYDFYQPNALIALNRLEIPQKPEVATRYFDNNYKGKVPGNIWCRGEGKNGVLHGRWEQNYAAGIPWIVGFYQHGKRTGQWKEYYQGTKQLCRTEVWRNDKLNGVRRRYDRSGNLIEEIDFRDGVAMTKTNYSLEDSLVWVRKPLDSSLVHTEIYTRGGALIAVGKERIHNPGNLLWFQNIELTALNMASITSRDLGNGGSNDFLGQGVSLYNQPALVDYRKEGEWVYFPEPGPGVWDQTVLNSRKSWLVKVFPHFGPELVASLERFEDAQLKDGYDSLRVDFSDNELVSFYGEGPQDYANLQVRYYEESGLEQRLNPYILSGLNFRRGEIKPLRMVREAGSFNDKQQKIGLWKLYDRQGVLYKTENFILPEKEEEGLVGK